MAELRARHRRWITTEALPLVAIVVVAAAAASSFALGLVQYVIMPDELGYVKQSVELGHGTLVTPDNPWFNSWALLRPLTLAPFYRWMSTTSAFDAAHVLGAILMASTAIPSYLLARRVVAWRPAALLVAGLSVAVPWLAMAGTMMTEVVAYPAFTWAVLAMVWAVERPGWRSDLVLGAALALVFLARTQLVILAPAFAAAVVLEALARAEEGRGPLRRLADAARAHWLLLSGLALVVLGVVATGSIRRFLGGYVEPARGALFPPGTGHAMHELLAYVVVGIGVVPLAFSLGWIALALGRRRGGAGLATASVFLCAGVALVVVGGAFTVRFAGGINDRYLFYIAPLLFTGMAAGLTQVPDRRWRLAMAGGGLLALWLAWTADLAQHGPSLVSVTMAFHDVLSERGSDVGLSGPHVAAAAALVVIAAALALARRAGPERLAAGVGALVLAFCVWETAYTYDRVGATQEGVSKAFLEQRGWVDRPLHYGARVGLLLAALGDRTTTSSIWWDTTFWNKSVDRIYRLPAGDHYGQGFTQSFAPDPETGRVAALDREEYFLRPGGDSRFGLHGTQQAFALGGLEVITAERPYRLDWLLDGPVPDDAVIPPGEEARLRVWGPPEATKATVTVGMPEEGDGGEAAILPASGEGGERGEVEPGGRLAATLPAPFGEQGWVDVVIRVPAGSKSAARLIGVSPE